MCSADAGWRSCTRRTISPGSWRPRRASRRTIRSSWIGTSRTRRRSTWTSSPTAGTSLSEGSRNTSRKRASTPATRRASCPRRRSDPILADIRSVTRRVCKALDVIGLMNLQLAVKDAAVYVLEANPRASRTVPYVSKAIGISLAKVATKVMLGHSLRSLHLVGEPTIDHVAVKAPVFPFQRLPGVDAILGPEMKSTGEVMGIDRSLGRAYYKAMVAAGNPLPTRGAVYMTVRDEDKPAILGVASRFVRLGLRISATRGTAQFLREHGVEATTV